MLPRVNFDQVNEIYKSGTEQFDVRKITGHAPSDMV